MTDSWMIQRLRSAFFRENSLVVVLRLLGQEELSEWEILSLMHSRFGSTPSSREFRRLCQVLLDGRYATIEPDGETRKLKLTPAGDELLRRLEEECREILTGFDSPGGLFTR